ncbi:MAG: T9SS type A sorting domain-containing protein [Saprospiraceae bacterium]|nr:T9SS type A sorting domain-containing protein [Saprospiraceae bacterium]
MSKSFLGLAAVYFLMVSTAYSQGEYIIEIDPATGSYIQPNNPINGVTYVLGHVSTYDEINGLYTFPASTINGLITVDFKDSIFYNPPIASIHECQYDNSSGILYGLHNLSSGEIVFGSVNPATADFSQIGAGPISGMNSLFQGMSTFDNNNHRYIVYASDNSLFSIDALSGNVLSNPTVVLNSGESLVHFCYDDSTNNLYGLLQNSSKTFLVQMNTSTGAITKIGNGTNYGFGGGASTIDELNRHYIYSYTVSGAYFVAVIDIITGSLIYNNPILFAKGGNINSVEYDNVKNKLYGQHWDVSTPSGVNQLSSLNSLIIFPNPFSTQTTLQTDKPLHNATLTVGNCFGETVLQMKYISNQTIIFNRDNLPSGQYFVRLTEENKIIAVDKLVITD